MTAALPAILKVCLISPYPPQESGMAEYANMLVDAFHASAFQRRLQVHVISEINEQYPKSRMLLYPPDKNFVLERVYPDKMPYSIFNFLRIFKAITKDKPHVAHFYWPGCYGGFMAGFTGEPLLVLFALLRLLSIRVLVTMQSVWFPYFAEKAVLERTKSGIVAKVAKAYFFVFLFTLCHLANRILIGVIKEGSMVTKRFAKCYKISNSRIGEEPFGCFETEGTDLKIVHKIKRRLKITGKKVVLCFGFIRPDKGFEYPIMALPEIIKEDQNVMLIIVGKPKSGRDIKYLSMLKSLVRELKLERHVIFDTRFISREEIIDYYSIADVVLLPYTENVGFSGALNTAVSLGVPVIATSVGEQMPHLGELAKLIPPRDVKALKDALNEMLSSPAFRDAIRTKLLSHARNYSWSRIAEKFLNLYGSMLATSQTQQ